MCKFLIEPLLFTYHVTGFGIHCHLVLQLCRPTSLLGGSSVVAENGCYADFQFDKHEWEWISISKFSLGLDFGCTVRGLFCVVTLDTLLWT